MRCFPITTLAAATLAAAAGCAAPACAQDRADADFAQRVFAGSAGKPASYACFVRHYDAEHMAQHPLQKVSAMRLLITGQKLDATDKYLDYSFRVGVNFRDRPGDFDSSGDCGHAPTVKDDLTDVPADEQAPRPAGVDFSCNVDCDGGGMTVALANKDAAIILKLDRIRIWKGKSPDADAAGALEAGADDKIFRLDRATIDECAALAIDRKELAAMRRKPTPEK